ncbi:protein transport protein Sec16A isoform X1 [Elephas maximus indicus]|uniref:protein transport protein Sec16A isoform X1 n=1 Tax=Elephas maximus indicus TaxID=99487 RepID=UPI0021162402|nr:protein transport protein Sec16A isoform X1 [Elephas maximus indicus]XP_049751741.1 protein transport protein Sec16A isoform X1 [Elephas maximus indicus]
MQPPPQAAPSGLIGPPPVGNSRSVFWSNSSYRRRVSSNVPTAPLTCPLQPVTDPFAFSRQLAQDTSLDTLSRSSLPVMPGPAPPAFSQHPALPTPHPSAGDPPQGPCEPVPGPFLQPGVETSLFSSALAPLAPPGPEANKSAEMGPSSAPDVPTPPNPPQYIPGVGPDSLRGAAPGPTRPLSRQSPRDSAGLPATASSFFPQLPLQTPDPWTPVQGSPRPSGQHYSPSPQGPGHGAAPRASGLPHCPPQPSMHQSPGREQQHNPLAPVSGPLAGDERNETAYLQSGNHSTSHFDPENTFRQNPRAGLAWVSQEFRQNQGGGRELGPDPALASLLAQGNGSDHHPHCPPGVAAGRTLPDPGSAALSMFFQGGETENEENVSAEKAGCEGPSAFDGFCTNPGLGHPPPTHAGTGGPYQAFLQGPRSETTQPGGDSQPYFSQSAGSQHEQPAGGNAAVDMWGETAGRGQHSAPGPQCESVENQEVLPSEPLGLNPSSLSDPFCYGAFPGPSTLKNGVVSHAGGGGPNLEAPDAPARPDSVSSGYGGKDHRALPSSARPQELVGTFIQQEVGKLDEDASGSFFKQIDSSPVGGETEETPVSQNYHHSLSQPSTPSPPKPTGIFQTSANSSFEPVKSHFVGVKPFEADHANVVGEVRGSRVRQKKRRPATALPDASPGNLEQPPDNRETLFTPPACLLPLGTAVEPGHMLPHAGGLLSETGLPTPERRPSTRAQGAVKCESPATTLWAQNELPDFGGNVLLAPAAPVLCVPTKPQASEVIQPPDEGTCGQQPHKRLSVSPLQNRDGIGASENLENPPKMGEEEAFQPQASSSYTSLLSSPPTESLHGQPVLVPQPDQTYNLAQPINFSVSSSNHNEKNPPERDPLLGDRPTMGSWALPGESGESTSLFGITPSALVSPPLPSSLAQGSFPQGSGPEMLANQPATLLAQPSSHPAPVSVASERQKNHAAETVPPAFANSPGGSVGVLLVPPVSSSLAPDHSDSRDETSGALNFTLNRTLGNPLGMCGPSHSDHPGAAQQTLAGQPRQPGLGAHNPDHFYQHVTKTAQGQSGPERAQPESGPPEQLTLASQVPRAALPERSSPGSPPVPGQAYNSTQPPASPALADTRQQVLPWPTRSSSASITSAGSSQAAGRSEPQWPPPPPPDLPSCYYYGSFYDVYPPQYPLPYPPEPGTAPLYYQDMYGLYRPYDGAMSAYAENYRCPEPERPSSRASHCSDRPAPRQGYPEGYYTSKGGWSSQSDYYANYYSSQYDYGDPGRWDRYHYGSRFRGARAYDQRYWYDAEYNPYRKEPYAYGDRPERYDDPWRYDPRFTSSFEEDAELHREPYGEEGDRRSVHSEHSAQSLHSAPSLHSRRSSVSAHSQQSQIYRNHNVTAGSYDPTALPGSFRGDYGYGTYGSDFNGVQAFPEYGYPAGASWSTTGAAPSRPSSPEKFSVPHVCARFGPGGQLIKVIPNLPSEGQPALVEVHSMETLLQHTPEQEELRSFPGPLGKDDTHKVDVINFAQQKATKCFQDENIIDKESASLLWNFIVLLCRQNGTVVGTDIAELLLRDHRTAWLPGKSPSEANLIDFTNEAVEQVEEEESGEAQLSFLTDSQAASTSSLEKETERFRELLLYGRKKDALESAMKNGLWGHALLLASKMDSRTHARVMTRFANSLPINDPLQTVYQLMSGRMPAASTCCGDEKWGDWRPHLAMVLSNLNNNMEVESRTMATMGDTLASKGLLDAAHFCYLMAQADFGVYTKKTSKLVLMGSNHSLPFLKFATNEAIQRTEAYEYAQSLGAHTCSLPHFQVYKFIYACRLADMGLATQAFHYCEAIAKSILARPHAHSTVLISQLIQVASRLRLFDPQLKEKPEEESFVEPAWLVQLQHVERQIQEGAGVWRQDGAFPPQRPSTPSSEVEQYDGPGPGQPAALSAENPLLVLPLPNAELSSSSVQLLPSAPQTFPATQQPGPTRVPLFPVPPPPGPVEPGPVCAPPGSALGFPEPMRPDLTVLYPGAYPVPGTPAGAPGLQQDEPRHQDPGLLPRESPVRNSLSEATEEDFGGNVANLDYQSQDSEPNVGWELNDSGRIPAPEVKRPVKAAREEVKEPKKSVESWFSRWLPGKRRTEAHLPDDKNKSIVWDEKKNQWVNLNEPEEEKKAPPPPPTAFPKAPQDAPPGPGSAPRATVNMFSRKAGGTRNRYVDILNPSGTTRGEPVLAPAEFFAPLAPLPIPGHLLVPSTVGQVKPPDALDGATADCPILFTDVKEPQPVGAGDPGGQAPVGGQERPESALETKIVSSMAQPLGSEFPPCGADTSQGGELSRCSSVSSLSREVSQHFDQAPSDQPPAGGPPGGAVPFYNPAQFAQVSAASGGPRMGRMGQRKHPALK